MGNIFSAIRDDEEDFDALITKSKYPRTELVGDASPYSRRASHIKFGYEKHNYTGTVLMKYVENMLILDKISEEQAKEDSLYQKYLELRKKYEGF